MYNVLKHYFLKFRYDLTSTIFKTNNMNMYVNID